jgi:hypothetical protein
MCLKVKKEERINQVLGFRVLRITDFLKSSNQKSEFNFLFHPFIDSGFGQNKKRRTNQF